MTHQKKMEKNEELNPLFGDIIMLINLSGYLLPPTYKDAPNCRVTVIRQKDYMLVLLLASLNNITINLNLIIITGFSTASPIFVWGQSYKTI